MNIIISLVELLIAYFILLSVFYKGDIKNIKKSLIAYFITNSSKFSKTKFFTINFFIF